MRFGWLSFASDGIGAQRSCSDGGNVSCLAVKRSKSVRNRCLFTKRIRIYSFLKTKVLGDDVILRDFVRC